MGAWPRTAGPTLYPLVIPTKAGIHQQCIHRQACFWIPAFVGMTTISPLFERLTMMDSRLRGNDGGERGNDSQGLCISMLMRKPCYCEWPGFCRFLSCFSYKRNSVGFKPDHSRYGRSSRSVCWPDVQGLKSCPQYRGLASSGSL